MDVVDCCIATAGTELSKLNQTVILPWVFFVVGGNEDVSAFPNGDNLFEWTCSIVGRFAVFAMSEAAHAKNCVAAGQGFDLRNIVFLIP